MATLYVVRFINAAVVLRNELLIQKRGMVLHVLDDMYIQQMALNLWVYIIIIQARMSFLTMMMMIVTLIYYIAAHAQCSFFFAIIV